MADIKFRVKKFLYLALWALGVGAGYNAQIEPASAQIPPEVACEQALRLNTIEALEEYLRNYPNADTACNALALDALRKFGNPQFDGRDGDGVSPSDGGYGG